MIHFSQSYFYFAEFYPSRGILERNARDSRGITVIKSSISIDIIVELFTQVSPLLLSHLMTEHQRFLTPYFTSGENIAGFYYQSLFFSRLTFCFRLFLLTFQRKLCP